jgi:hypothetical protein
VVQRWRECSLVQHHPRSFITASMCRKPVAPTEAGFDDVMNLNQDLHSVHVRPATLIASAHRHESQCHFGLVELLTPCS